jgi:hypothetical protein
MDGGQPTGRRFAVAVAAYIVFFSIPTPVSTGTRPDLLILEIACATLACVSMISATFLGKGPARMIAALLALPPAAFLIYTAALSVR